MIVTGEGAAVGLNGGFVHTVQLGAHCLPGTECQAGIEPYAFALLRVQVTPAAAERQERQRLSERGGVISSELPFSALRPQLHFPLSHEALS